MKNPIAKKNLTLFLVTTVLTGAPLVHSQVRSGGTGAPAVPLGGSIMTPVPQSPLPGSNPNRSNNPSAFGNGVPADMTTNGMFTGTNAPSYATNVSGLVTEYFVPAGANGYYRRGANGFYLRGTNGFYRLAPNGAYEFFPDGDEVYRRGPDGIYRWYEPEGRRQDRDAERGIYRNGVLTTDTNGDYDRNGGRGIYRNGVLTMDTTTHLINASRV